MDILVTGAKGQLGSELNAISTKLKGINFYFTDIEELDITSAEAINTFLEKHEVDVIINCAAYTAVDKAEDEYELALKINRDAVRNLVDACNANDTGLIHISTDYVFSGNSHRPYVETDPVDPISAYGKSKVLGEKEILEHAKQAVIIRTAWLYSEFGNNFVKTILKKGNRLDELKVVFDQVGCPTYARDLVFTCLLIADNMPEKGTEIFHYSNEGVCGWYDFALAIKQLGGFECMIMPISSDQYPLPAPRPYYSVFNKKQIKEKLCFSIPHWRTSLAKCIERINIDEL